jgi:hypothetical protein
MRALAAIAGILLPASALAVQVTLMWEPPSDVTGIDGYQVHCGPTGKPFSVSQKVAGADSSQVVFDLAGGEWYCSAQSYADSGIVSDYSKVLAFWIYEPPPPPEPTSGLPTPSGIKIMAQTGG